MPLHFPIEHNILKMQCDFYFWTCRLLLLSKSKCVWWVQCKGWVLCMLVPCGYQQVWYWLRNLVLFWAHRYKVSIHNQWQLLGMLKFDPALSLSNPTQRNFCKPHKHAVTCQYRACSTGPVLATNGRFMGNRASAFKLFSYALSALSFLNQFWSF